ncbi:MAG TPA: hypothetical protein VLC46_22495 [Thermoanaerobaculia bacterium]|jgi:hypothetical protein|nr:hypothetical protein [Thermoanaerobaculia bacterium]
MLIFLETPVFTRRIAALLSDLEYATLQGTLIVNPESGDLIPGSGGLRKIRWHQQNRGKGKRGGMRIIYYWYSPGSVIYMLLAYSKGAQDDLSASEKRILKKLVTEEFP